MVRVSNYDRRGAVAAVLGLLLLMSAVGAHAQGLVGLWGSPLYRVQLVVTGATISGTFTPADDPRAPAGKISGQLQPDGRGFSADWTRAVGPDTQRFATALKLNQRGDLLSGYRWTEETLPASFALHRAVNGQVPVLVSEDTATGTSPPTTTTATIPTTTGAPRAEVIVCGSVVNGQPQNVSDAFTTPKSIAALVRYTNLPANSTLDWLWTLDGRQEAKLTKTLAGTGWHMHGLRSDTALVPGAYQLTVTLNGQVVARRTITVRAAATTTPTTTTAPNPPGMEVVMCVSAPGGVAQSPGTQFTKPQSLICLVKYRDLPANTELKWVWVRNGAQMGVHTKAVGGATGWATHGYTNANGMTPGTYKVTIYAAGSVVTTATATVK